MQQDKTKCNDALKKTSGHLLLRFNFHIVSTIFHSIDKTSVWNLNFTMKSKFFDMDMLDMLFGMGWDNLSLTWDHSNSKPQPSNSQWTKSCPSFLTQMSQKGRKDYHNFGFMPTLKSPWNQNWQLLIVVFLEYCCIYYKWFIRAH